MVEVLIIIWRRLYWITPFDRMINEKSIINQLLKPAENMLLSIKKIIFLNIWNNFKNFWQTRKIYYHQLMQTSFCRSNINWRMCTYMDQEEGGLSQIWVIWKEWEMHIRQSLSPDSYMCTHTPITIWTADCIPCLNVRWRSLLVSLVVVVGPTNQPSVQLSKMMKKLECFQSDAASRDCTSSWYGVLCSIH